MIKNRRHLLSALIIAVFAIALSGCNQEELLVPAEGTLHLSIGNISQETETRATPAQLGKPLAEKFNLRVQRSQSDRVFYDGEFVEDLKLGVGSYEVTAYYGEDVVLGKDAPYYEGVATVEIEEDKSTSATIPCRVANALVSVVFGRDEEERKRFERYYTHFGLMVRIGEHSLALTGDEPMSSIYFPAGSSPTLLFYGTLKGNGDLVWCEVTSEDLPNVFAAADHATITLSLPNPESALNVNISKAELETVTIHETVPLSWLPAPKATAQHRYNSAGELVGTALEFSNSYVGMQWRAVVANSSGQEVRRVEGSGKLTSPYASSSDWPYLPSGDYKATYYIIDGEVAHEVNSREFNIGRPELNLAVGGYSSYTKYLEGDVEAANQCDPQTIYSPMAKLNVSEDLLAKYPYAFTIQYASMSVENVASIMPGKNTWKIPAPIENQAVSLSPYRLNANATFDGVLVSNYKDFYITGLPVTYAPPTKAEGWVPYKTVEFSSDKVQLGDVDFGWEYDESITNANFAIPRNTRVALDYDIEIYRATAGTALTITIGTTEMLVKESGGTIWKAYPYEGTEVRTLTEEATEFKCKNSYGGGNTCTYIYSLSLKYGE